MTTLDHKDRRAFLVARNKELHDIMTQAIGADSYGPAAQANKQMVQNLDKINQFDAELAATESIPTDPDERDRELVRELRTARAGARACSSWVAVSNLSTKEAELNAAQRARLDAKRARDMSASTEQQKVDAFTAVFGALPPSLQAQILAAIVQPPPAALPVAE